MIVIFTHLFMPSSDPKQEKLRQDKAKWNKQVSLFINDLIHVKKTMNGWPSKFYMQRSKIQDPIPSNPASIIDRLADNFQDIARGGNTLVQEQLNYSKTRKRKQPQLSLAPKPSTPTIPTAPSVDLSKELSLPLVASLEMDLISEASNPLSRFLAVLKAPRFTGGWLTTRHTEEEISMARHRTAMLSIANDMYKDLSRLEGEVVGFTATSIFAAERFLFKIEGVWSGFEDHYNKWTKIEEVQKKRKGLEDPEKKPEEGEKTKEETKKEEEAPKEEKKSVEEPKKIEEVVEEAAPKEKGKKKKSKVKKTPAAPISKTPAATPIVPEPPPVEDPIVAQAISFMQDFAFTHLNLKTKISLDANLLKQMSALIMKFREPNANRLEIAKQVIPVYQAILADANAKAGTNAPSLAKILTMPTELKTAALKKVEAENFLTKWFGKTYHKLTLTDKSSALRIDIFKLAERARRVLNQMMNLLEEDINPNAIKEMMELLDADITNMRLLMIPLYDLIKHKLNDKDFVNMLKTKSLTDYDIGLDEKGQSQLERLIRNKKLRQISQTIR